MALPTRQVGDGGERRAKAYLEDKGLECLASNYRTRWGELDLVMRDGGAVVFVEVKTRRSTAYGSPQEAVHSSKQGRMLKAALMFIKDRRLAGQDYRFDVVAVNPDGSIEHLPDAFSPDSAEYTI
ncbi:MAG TPA: YraN family protein [Elusimicrobiota bacterium]|nr:YraN family protein [Elusimicrobiota bacterium]